MENISVFISRHDGVSLRICVVLTDILNASFSLAEKQKSVNRLKNKNSQGMDGIPYEFYKYLNCLLLRSLTALFNYVNEIRCD